MITPEQILKVSEYSTKFICLAESKDSMTDSDYCGAVEALVITMLREQI